MRMDEHEGSIRFRAYCKRHTDHIASEEARQAALVMPPDFLQLQEMRRDLERLRLLTELVQRREILKSDVTKRWDCLTFARVRLEYVVSCVHPLLFVDLLL